MWSTPLRVFERDVMRNINRRKKQVNRLTTMIKNVLSELYIQTMRPAKTLIWNVWQETASDFQITVLFLLWRIIQSSKMLWLSAYPVCGKSVFSKYLIDRRVRCWRWTWKRQPYVIYFFFKRWSLLMSKICIQYLSFQDLEKEISVSSYKTGFHEVFWRPEIDYCFLLYLAQQWAIHFPEAESLPDLVLIDTMVNRTCDKSSRSFEIGLLLCWFLENRADFRFGFTNLIVESYFGHAAVVEWSLQRNNVNINARDDLYSRTPLSWTTRNGHEAVIVLLLRGDVEADCKDYGG